MCCAESVRQEHGVPGRGATAFPNDPTNGGRALLLFRKNAKIFKGGAIKGW